MCEKISLTQTKYVRGQVWMVDEDEDITKLLRDNGSTIINGSRPYMIIASCGTTVTCIPLTSNTSSFSGSEHDIVFPSISSDHKESRLIIPMITSKCTKDFSRYMYQFSEEAVEIILRKVSVYLGINIDEMSMKKDKDIEKREQIESLYDNAIDAIKEYSTESSKPVCRIPEIDPAKIKALDDHLNNYHRGKGNKLFRDKEEALLYLAVYGDMNTRLVSNKFGISPKTVSGRRNLAKRIARGIVLI